MTEKQLIKPVCVKCGENARPHAQFCFACGGQIVEGADTGEEPVSSEWFKGDIVKGEEAEADKSASDAADSDSELKIEQGADGLKSSPVKIKEKDSKALDKNDESKLRSSTSKLKTASDLRRKPKPMRSKTVEVVWEERNDSPNVMFLIFGLLFFLLACGIAALAIYFK